MRETLHDCRRCGASCQGLRARVRPDERERLASHAVTLGVDRPLDGDHLRQNWGRCVFLSDGACALHARFGAAAKPRTCRTFPRLDGAVDPTCFHPGPAVGAAAHVDWEDLTDGHDARRWLDALALPALLDGPVLGPEVACRLRPLIRARPSIVPAADRPALAIRFAVLRDHHLVPQNDPVAAAHGGAQLLAGVEALAAFPAWVRLLKLGVFGRSA